MIIEEGYEQLSEYVNARTKVTMRCPEGHEFEILPNNWKKGSRCGKCYREKLKRDGVINRKISNLQQDKEETSISKKEYNKEEWGKFIKYIQTHSLFKFIKIPNSNGKMELIHNTSGSSLEIWVLQSINDDDKLLKGVVPIYLEDSDITTDLNYLKDWMKETHRNY